MARATHQLTAIKVARLKAPGFYPDGLGLYLRITQGGGKAWIYRFTANRAAQGQAGQRWRRSEPYLSRVR